MVIMTIGEIFIWPAVPAAAQDLAPVGRSGFYQGVVGSAATAGRMLGPLAGGILFEMYNPQIMLYGMVLFCGLAFICFAFFDRLLKK
jgi:MFS family permease